MADRLVGWIAADEPGGKVAGLLELGQVCTASGHAQPPVQVQLVLYLAGRGIGPLAAARHHEGCGAEYLVQLGLGLLRLLIAFDRKGEPLRKIAFRACSLFVNTAIGGQKTIGLG